MQESETNATSVARLREQGVTLGLILRVPLRLAEDIERRIAADFSGKLVYVRWSAGRLYICDEPQKPAREGA